MSLRTVLWRLSRLRRAWRGQDGEPPEPTITTLPARYATADTGSCDAPPADRLSALGEDERSVRSAYLTVRGWFA